MGENRRDLCVVAAWWRLHGSSQCVSIGARRARGRGPPGALRPSPFDLWLGPHWTSLALWLLPSLPLAPSLFFLLFFFRLSTSIDRANTSFHLLLSYLFQSSTSSTSVSFLPLPIFNFLHDQIISARSRKSNFLFYPCERISILFFCLFFFFFTLIIFLL